MKVHMNDTKEVGQFIPLHYHFAMLYDSDRIAKFRTALDYLLTQDDVVLELGGGTGILSFFAAQKAKKVYSVEFNGELVDQSRHLLKMNKNSDKIEIVHEDAFLYMPPEPVNIVICEMLHVGLLREKQLAMIESFKARYQDHFKGHKLPIFVPGATLQAVQPVNHDFNFEGFYAPLPLFQSPYVEDLRTTPLGDPIVYNQIIYDQPYDLVCRCDETINFTTQGTLNAVRIITKNIIAVEVEKGRTIDWHNQYLVLPLDKEIAVSPGKSLSLRFEYTAGDRLSALKPVVKCM